MSTTTMQEILVQEERLATAKRMLDLDALDRIYASDLLMTGVLGEPTCSKAAIIEEVKRGIAERDRQANNEPAFETSCRNEDVTVRAHGETAIASYRFIVTFTRPSGAVHRRYRTTNVWIQRDGRWQIIAAHTAFVLDAKQATMLTA